MRDKELRLALVCYGGISLAVYMHGITKEIWHLARASRAFHDGHPSKGIESVYQDLLVEMQTIGDVRLRVLPDIVAGASAGGINGIFLAQAVATGQSLEPLTELWLASADVEALIDPGAAPASRFSKVWALPLAWMAAGRSADSVDALDDDATREEVRAKLSHFIRSRWFEPPFGGPVFTGMLIDALAAMATSEAGPRLLPQGQPLDLFVTVTDFTGHAQALSLNTPAEVIETEHRVVIGFTDRGLERNATLADPAELTFAARATSSFPGAFPPFTVRELDSVLKQRRIAWPGRRGFLRRVLPQHRVPAKVVLIDGSVLANAPFRPAIDALKDRPARREIDRRFVYIDPSPGMKFKLARQAEIPGFFQTILGALSELPRQQPIRDNLDALAQRSARIEQMRGILRAIRPEVEREIDTLFGHTFFLDRPTPARLAAWRHRAQDAAAARAGYAYAAYARLKIAGVIDTVTTLLHSVSGQPGRNRRRRSDAAIRTACDASIEAHGEIAFLKTFDLNFRVRRLRLLARRMVEMEVGQHAEFAGLRDAIYRSLSGYLDRQRGGPHKHLQRAVRSARGEATPLLDALAASLNLTALDAATDQALTAALARLDREPRRRLLLTYLGFPYYDTATLPLLHGEGLDEFDPIKVDRIAPDDATSIRAGGAEATLKGIQFNSFGAFFSRAYRENDYLWGRLHGAERVIDITTSTLAPPARLKPSRIAAIKRRAFTAILDEEEPRLTAIAPLFKALRAEIG